MTALGAVHVIGAGLAGLAAAVALVGAGRKVTVWETSPRAGGRCRSWFDPVIGGEIDNGAHLALSGNHALRRYLALCGASERMRAVQPAALPFVDIGAPAGALPAWTLRPGAPMLLSAAARPPGVSAADLICDLWRLLRAGPQASAADALAHSPAYARLWRPLTVSALNALPEEAAAHLLAAVARETLLRGEAYCRPMLPVTTLADALVAPALATLAGAGADVHFSARVGGLTLENDRVGGFSGATLGPQDAVVLAVPPWAAAELLPGFAPPPMGGAIVNVHFHARLPLPPLLGLIGGRTDWLFQRDQILTATISAADDLASLPADDVAALVWREACVAAGSPPPPLPVHRVVKERRAAVSALPAHQAARPPAATRWRNVFLAGDWTATGLPSTMEGAIRSGFSAAECLLRP